MERKNSSDDQNRKRTRDEGDNKNELSKKLGKKHIVEETIVGTDSSYKEKGFEFYDGIGVFDFPWLKEGPVSNMDEYLDPEDMYSSSSFTWCWHLLLDEANYSDTFAFDCQPAAPPPIHDPPPISNYINIENHEMMSCNNWRSNFNVVDDFEPIDCIWSSVIDQPLGFNKSYLS